MKPGESAHLGRIQQVNISGGGVPKLPVERAEVRALGLAGDGHNDLKHHGGPDRAVCLLSLEAIERLRAEGHPIAPGAIGENLTVSGLSEGALVPGRFLQIGEAVVLELTGYASPCATIAASFAGGRYDRVSPKSHPSDSRLYARVLREGVVAPGDPIRIVSQAPAED